MVLIKHSHQKASSASCSATHLYLKGNVYYFRYSLPKPLRSSLGGGEIHLSLRTPYLRKAKRMVEHLRALLTTLLQEHPMLPLNEIKARLAQLLLSDIDLQGRTFERLENNQSINELLLGSGANEDDAFISAEHMHAFARRLYSNSRMQEEFWMGQKAEKLFGPEAKELSPSMKDDLLAEEYSPESFFVAFADSKKAILTQQGLFTEEEFLVNKAVIGKQSLLSTILYYEYMMKDESGDLLGAQRLLQDFMSTLGPASSSQPAPQAQTAEKPPLLFSEAVERYVSAKLNAGAWKAHNLKDNANRLNTFIDVIGDKDLHAITRADMRCFVDKLQLLPPNRTKLSQYKGKSVDEIIAMKPSTTLNTKTINTILGAVCSFLEWYIDEGLLSSNPAKKLQIKDQR